MRTILRSLLYGFLSSFRRRAVWQLEVIALRQQPDVLRRNQRRALTASPLYSIADQVVLCPTESSHLFSSMVTICELLEALIGVAIPRSDRVTVERLAEIDQSRLNEGVYWKPD